MTVTAGGTEADGVRTAYAAGPTRVPEDPDEFLAAIFDPARRGELYPLYHALRAAAPAPDARGVAADAARSANEARERLSALVASVRAPESPEVHFALARAYARAGREDDAARERATFARLEQERMAAGGAGPSGHGEARP